MKYAKIFTLCFLFVYASMAFTFLEYDVSNWTVKMRGASIVFGFITSFIISIMVDTDER